LGAFCFFHISTSDLKSVMTGARVNPRHYIATAVPSKVDTAMTIR
jgi:hypothetical protein